MEKSSTFTIHLWIFHLNVNVVNLLIYDGRANFSEPVPSIEIKSLISKMESLFYSVGTFIKMSNQMTSYMGLFTLWCSFPEKMIPETFVSSVNGIRNFKERVTGT